MPEEAAFFFHPDYPPPENPFADPQRALKIIGHLVRRGYLLEGRIRTPRPADIADLARVHSYDYLEQLADPDVVQRAFANASYADAPAIFRQQRAMVGGTIEAARALVESPGGRLIRGINLGGGFHHAMPDHAQGFCLLNDVAVAIHVIRAGGFEGRVLIVDLDLHPGDGNRAVFAEDSTVYTFSLHAKHWHDDEAEAEAGFEAVADRHVELGLAVGDAAYLRALRLHLPVAFAEARPDLVFYVAGVDVAEDDVVGGWRVDPDTILRRDQMVLQLTGPRPLVWTLAGGYGTDAWRHSARSLAWMLSGDESAIASEGDLAVAQFRRIKRRLEQSDLTRAAEEDFRITEEDLFGSLELRRGPERLLGFYTVHGIETALERYGVLAHLRREGFDRVEVSLSQATSGQRVQVHSADSRRDLLIEVVVHESGDVPPYRLVAIEWMLLQNPRRVASPDRPRLPGQDHPGLGCLKQIVLMLLMACERLGFDGLLYTPAHYHMAALARGWATFLDPEDEARFLAVEHALAGVPLGRASAMVAEGRVVVSAGQPVRWSPAPMVHALHPELDARISGDDYESAVQTLANRYALSVVSSRRPPEPA
jgi:acetoin utilization deacetylase AcuC-like enzyme